MISLEVSRGLSGLIEIFLFVGEVNQAVHDSTFCVDTAVQLCHSTVKLRFAAENEADQVSASHTKINSKFPGATLADYES